MRSPVNQKVGRDTPLERNAGILAEEEHCEEVTYIPFIGQFFRIFVSIWPVVYFFTPVWSMDPSQDAFLLRWIPPQKPICACLYLLWSGAPFLFGPQEGFLACADREVFPDLRSGFTPLDQHQVSGLEAHCLLPQKAPPRVLT